MSITILTIFMLGFRKICREGGPDSVCYSHLFHRGPYVWTSFEKQLDLGGPIPSRRGSIPGFLRKHIATCDFSGEEERAQTPCPKSNPLWIHAGFSIVYVLFICKHCSLHVPTGNVEDNTCSQHTALLNTGTIQ